MKKAAALSLILLLLLSVFVAIAKADDEPSGQESPSTAAPGDRGAGYLPYSEPTAFGSGGFLGAILRTVFSLAVVLGLLYVALLGLKRLSPGSGAIVSNDIVHVIGRVYLNPKTVIYFVRLADEVMVLGAGSGSLSLLTIIKDAGQIDQIEKALKGGQYASGKVFSRLLDKSIKRFQHASDKDELSIDDNIRTLDDRLGQLRDFTRRRRSSEE